MPHRIVKPSIIVYSYMDLKDITSLFNSRLDSCAAHLLCVRVNCCAINRSTNKYLQHLSVRYTMCYACILCFRTPTDVCYTCVVCFRTPTDVCYTCVLCFRTPTDGPSSNSNIWCSVNHEIVHNLFVIQDKKTTPFQFQAVRIISWSTDTLNSHVCPLHFCSIIVWTVSRMNISKFPYKI